MEGWFLYMILTVDRLLPPMAADPIRVTYSQPTEGVVMVDAAAIPRIVTGGDRGQSCQRLHMDFGFIEEFVRATDGAPAVVATECQFGWAGLSVNSVALFVDAANTKPLLEAALKRDQLTFIVPGKYKLLSAAEWQRAKNLVEPPHITDRVALSKIKSELRSNPTIRVADSTSTLALGQSISMAGTHTKGSIGIFLAPVTGTTRFPADGKYALTAGHVVLPANPSSDPTAQGISNPMAATNAAVVTPGGIDILTKLVPLVARDLPENRVKAAFWLERMEEECATVLESEIGAYNGWRIDWGLLKLHDSAWEGTNCWFEPETILDAWLANSTGPGVATFTGYAGVVGHRDPIAGEHCLKDGATTGCTIGLVGLCEAHIFSKGTAKAVTEAEIGNTVHGSDVNHFTAVIIQPVSPLELCAPGDSGCGGFAANNEADGWSFLGLFVSAFDVQNVTYGFLAPQSQVFGSLRSRTGIDWALAGAGAGWVDEGEEGGGAPREGRAV
jgi:hypothetical protein